MKQYDIAAYVWPSYTGREPRARQFWEQGIGEWQSVLSAEKRTADQILPRKPLRDYGIPHEQLALFAESVLKNQTRLLKNNYVPLSREDMLAIYESVY